MTEEIKPPETKTLDIAYHYLEAFKRSGYEDIDIKNMSIKLKKKIKKLDAFIFDRTGLHLGETITIVKSYYNKEKKKLFVLPDEMLCTTAEKGFWYFHVSGYDRERKRLRVGRFFRSGTGTSQAHYTLSSLKFIATPEKMKEYVMEGRTNGGTLPKKHVKTKAQRKKRKV